MFLFVDSVFVGFLENMHIIKYSLLVTVLLNLVLVISDLDLEQDMNSFTGYMYLAPCVLGVCYLRYLA